MAIDIGGHNKGTASGATSVSTGTFTSTSGSALVAGGATGSGTAINSFTDNKGNGSATLLSTELTHNNAVSRMGFWQNIAGGAGHTVAINVSGADDLTVFATEVTGAAAASVDDGAARQADSATPYTSTTITTTVGNDLLIGMIISDEAGAVTYTAGNSFTIIESELTGTFWNGALAHRFPVAVASYESSFTMTGASGNSKGIWVAAFKEAVGGGPPPTITWVGIIG